MTFDKNGADRGPPQLGGFFIGKFSHEEAQKAQNNHKTYMSFWCFFMAKTIG
jgi:hypothetical protein